VQQVAVRACAMVSLLDEAAAELMAIDF